MAQSLRSDGSASVELPLQLVVAMLVIAITLGIVYEGMDAYTKAQSETLADSVARSIETTANQVVKGGNMTTLIVKVPFGESGADGLEWFKVGVGPKLDGIYFKVRDGDVHQRFAGRPLLKLEDGKYVKEPIVLGKSSLLLNLRHVQDTTMDPPDFVAVWVTWT